MNNFSVNTLNKEGKSLLHEAVEHNSLSRIKFLIENAGADLNIEDRKGRRPLYRALMFSDRKVVRYLLEAGADTDITDSKGNRLLKQVYFDYLKSDKDEDVIRIPMDLALQKAIQDGDMETVDSTTKYLTENGPDTQDDVNPQDKIAQMSQGPRP